ncbi:MAG: class I SAM-dependent methyltransferase [Bryobacteraceae bacterium]|nr:class I SAM-dependent methyltransferase [Bryobacteraceae bacterium]
MPDRSFARAVAQQHFSQNDPAAWFDVLYKKAEGDQDRIPWVAAHANSSVLEWLHRELPEAAGRSALVVGCGLGEDAEALAQHGFNVTAFDIAPTAIEWARQRWADSRVQYVCADLFNLPSDWTRAFHFVLECYTVQALPPQLRPQTIAAVASLVGDNGRLLVVARARNEQDPPGDMPWPLTEHEIRLFETYGLQMLQLEDYMDREDPPVRRWRALMERTVE